jgi:hypothetical protein
MKTHLVMTVVFAGLCSQAALADPEADFWQQPQAKSVTRSTQSHDNQGVYGTPAEPAYRIVRLGPDSQSVKVAYGESVRFIVQSEGGSERSFAWRFDGLPSRSYVDLSTVAPPDLLDHDVRVFVAPDPQNSGK